MADLNRAETIRLTTAVLVTHISDIVCVYSSGILGNSAGLKDRVDAVCTLMRDSV